MRISFIRIVASLGKLRSHETAEHWAVLQVFQVIPGMLSPWQTGWRQSIVTQIAPWYLSWFAASKRRCAISSWMNYCIKVEPFRHLFIAAHHCLSASDSWSKGYTAVENKSSNARNSKILESHHPCCRTGGTQRDLCWDVGWTIVLQLIYARWRRTWLKQHLRNRPTMQVNAVFGSIVVGACIKKATSLEGWKGVKMDYEMRICFIGNAGALNNIDC